MKHILLLATLLFSMGAWAQTYPFAEGFHGQPSGQVPSGWSGDIPVLSYHGLNEEKGLAAEIGGADLVDSIISPLIGPLTNVSTVSFWYRIIDKNIYPSTPTTLGAGDKVEVFISNDGTNYDNVYTIDQSNHTSSFNFVRRKAFIPQYAGDMVRVKFVCSFGAGATYFVDIDSVVLRDDPTASISPVLNGAIVKLYPNPVNGSNAQVAIANSETYSINVYDILGNSICSANGSGTLPLPSSEWHSGMYMVQIKQSGRTLTQKLIVQ
ncbi:MAG: T9SS type A sorting domain-containing protein [Bacteroidetes bacterium]|nr:T9SS type A sorting domain-containing protein [Bacteroidota bacterium]